MRYCVIRWYSLHVAGSSPASISRMAVSTFLKAPVLVLLTSSVPSWSPGASFVLVVETKRVQRSLVSMLLLRGKVVPLTVEKALEVCSGRQFWPVFFWRPDFWVKESGLGLLFYLPPQYQNWLKCMTHTLLVYKSNVISFYIENWLFREDTKLPREARCLQIIKLNSFLGSAD